MSSPVTFHGWLRIDAANTPEGKEYVINNDKQMDQFAEKIELYEEHLAKLKSTIDLSKRTVVVLNPKKGFGFEKATLKNSRLKVHLVHLNHPVATLSLPSLRPMKQLLIISVESKFDNLAVSTFERTGEVMSEPEYDGFIPRNVNLKAFKELLGNDLYFKIYAAANKKDVDITAFDWFAKLSAELQRTALDCFTAAQTQINELFEREGRWKKLRQRIFGSNILADATKPDAV